MTILQVLKKYGPWLSMNELIEFTGRDKADLREEVKSLLEKGKIQKTGKSRATRYGTLKAKVPEPIDYKSEILKALQSAGELSWKELCDALESSYAHLQTPMEELISERRVTTNGRKRGVRFRIEAEGSILVEPPEAEGAEGDEEADEAEGTTRIKVAASPDPYRKRNLERPWRSDPTPWLDSLLRKATREELYALEYAMNHRTSMDPEGGRRLVVCRITLQHDKLDHQVRYVEKEAS